MLCPEEPRLPGSAKLREKVNLGPQPAQEKEGGHSNGQHVPRDPTQHEPEQNRRGRACHRADNLDTASSVHPASAWMDELRTQRFRQETKRHMQPRTNGSCRATWENARGRPLPRPRSVYPVTAEGAISQAARMACGWFFFWGVGMGGRRGCCSDNALRSVP